MRVVVAPDKFKGTLAAREAADAMAWGVRQAVPNAEIVAIPLADGGSGTVEALLNARGGLTEDVVVSGPLGASTTATYASLLDGRVAVEMAAAAGLELVPPDERDAMGASSRGVGELILGAIAKSFASGRVVERVDLVVGIGDSASTDGGVGAAMAVGWRFLDARGRELRPGGAALVDLARIDDDGAYETIRGLAKITGACDVDNPLVGPEGSARIFAPQKGASPGDVARLEDGLANLAVRIRSDLGRDVASRPMTGAGGGLAAGLLAFFDASLVAGFDLVAGAYDFGSLLPGADVVITGEGRVDAQSGRGKTTAGVATAARAAGVPCVVVAGAIDLDDDALGRLGFAAWRTIDDVDAAAGLARATEALVADRYKQA